MLSGGRARLNKGNRYYDRHACNDRTQTHAPARCLKELVRYPTAVQLTPH